MRRYLQADLKCNNEVRSRVTMRVFRVAQWLHRDRRTRMVILRKAWTAVWRSWMVVSHVDLWPRTAVGPGLRLRHGARGTVVHPSARLGSNVILFHNVTIGTRPGRRGLAVVGDGVVLGAGCFLLGGIAVGDGASVGAGCVVVHDVAAGCSAVGPPAQTRSATA